MTAPPSTPDRPAVVGVVARAAVSIAALTVLARVAGFGRILTLARTVGPTCLGDTYQAVNAVPNIVFEIVAGGALASLVVPLLAGTASARDTAAVERTSSALITRVLVILVPLAIGVAALAHPLTSILLSGKGCGPRAVQVGASMLRVFAPQIPLYGVGVVLAGVLQAHRRFTGPALAPLLSSLVVIGAYLTFAAVTAPGTDIASLSTVGELTLSVGTTLGVAALTVSMIVPLAYSGIRLRPRWRFDTHVGLRVRRLAVAGVLTLLAQQAAVAVTLRLGNGAGVPEGRYAIFTYAQTIFLLPWGVLAVPIATSIYPTLAARFQSDDTTGYARALAGTTTAVLWSGWAGAAVLIAAATPIATVVVHGAPGVADTAALADGVVAFAPGLLGYGIFALHSRALYARDDTRSAALAALVGWAVVIASALVAAHALDPARRVVALGLANSVGMTVLGVALVGVVAVRVGAPGVAGAGRALIGGLVAAAFAVIGGRLVATALGGGGVARAVLSTTCAAAVTAAVFSAVGFVLCGRMQRDVVVGAVRARLRRG